MRGQLLDAPRPTGLLAVVQRLTLFEEARRVKNERRLAAVGIARLKSTTMPLEPVEDLASWLGLGAIED